MKFYNGYFALFAAIAAVIMFLVEDFSFILGAIGFIIAYVGIWIYCIPMLIAESRDHPQYRPIIVLNLAGGWSGIFWLVALVWAVYNTGEEQS